MENKLKIWSIALLSLYVGKAIWFGAGFPDALVMLGLIGIYLADFIKPSYDRYKKIEEDFAKIKEDHEALKTHVQGLKIATQLQRRA